MSRTRKISSETAPVVELAVNAESELNNAVNGQAESKDQAALNGAEEMKLEAYEKIIEQNIGGFMLVGRALKAIQDEKLYREKFKTFSEYCQQRWGLSDKYAYRHIKAFTCMEELQKELSPNGKIRLPNNESQVRPLTSLESDKQAKAWQKVLAVCKDKPVTADDVQGVVDKMLGKTKQASAKSEPKSDQTEQTLAKIGKLVTKALKDGDSELTVAKLKKVLEKIQDMIESNQ